MMTEMVERAAIAFTGGKDSVLALHMVSSCYRKHITDDRLLKLCGVELNPVVLVSFRPRNSDDFKAHKQEWTMKQAESLGIPLVVKRIDGESSYEESYRKAIRELNEEYKVTQLVSGDIEDVGEGFMERAAKNTGVCLIRPLWKLPREVIFDLLQGFKIEYIVTLTKLDKLPEPISKRLLGHVITRDYLLEQFSWFDSNFGSENLASTVDLTGEWGEMHSMTRDCPLFVFTIDCEDNNIEITKTQFGNYMYLNPGRFIYRQKECQL